MFENTIQACADLAQHVATQAFDDDGSTATEAVRILSQGEVIDDQMMTTLVAAIGFRNVLAHEYGHVDADQVYDTRQTGLTVYDTCDLLLAVTGEASHVRPHRWVGICAG